MSLRYLESAFRCLVCSALLVSVYPMPALGADDPTYQSIKPIPEVQEEIDRIVSLFSNTEAWPEIVSKNLEQEQYYSWMVREYNSFQHMTKGDLFLQLVLAYGGKEEHQINPKSERTKRLLFSLLPLEIPTGELVSIVGPHFEKTTEPKLKGKLARILLLACSQENLREFDFTVFDAYLKGRKETPPHSLIELMYRMNPDGAVVSMARLYHGKALAEELRKIVARKEWKSVAEYCATSDLWWKNLYAIRIAEEHQVFVDIEKLGDFRHPFVREAAKRLMHSKKYEQRLSADEKQRFEEIKRLRYPTNIPRLLYLPPTPEQPKKEQPVPEQPKEEQPKEEQPKGEQPEETKVSS